MRLKEVLTEDQLNELSWKDVAKGAGKAIGATASGVVGAGKAASAAGKTFASGVKTGYGQSLGGLAKGAISNAFSKKDNPTDTSSQTSSNRPSGITYKQPVAGNSQLGADEIKDAFSQLPQPDQDALLKDLSSSASATTSPSGKQAPNLDIPTAHRQGKTISQTPPEAKPQGSVAQVGKQQSQPGQRQKGDMIKVGDNSLQWTGEPGKEWMIAGGTLSKANPQTDRMNRIQQANGKRFMSADDAKKLLQAESIDRVHSKFLGIDL